MPKYIFEYTVNDTKHKLIILAPDIERANRNFVRLAGRSTSNKRVSNIINLLWENMLMENSLIEEGGGLPVTTNHFYPEIMKNRAVEKKLKAFLDHDDEELWHEIEEQFVSGAYVADIKNSYEILNQDCEV